MNKFLEEKEKLLNSIENNTPKHWKEYYKDVPIDCIFEDLVIDINEIKRLTEENQQLKEQLKQKEDIINKAKEYIINNSLYEEEYDYDYEENIYLSGIHDDDVRRILLEILDNKGDENDG